MCADTLCATAHSLAMISWHGQAFYAPFVYLAASPHKPRPVDAATPLLAQRPQAVSSKLSQDMLVNAPTRGEPQSHLLPFADGSLRRVYHSQLQASDADLIQAGIKAQVAYAMQCYAAGDDTHACALYQAAMALGHKHRVPVVTWLDAGDVSPLYLAVLKQDVKLVHCIVQTAPLVRRDDMPLLLACVAMRDVAVLAILLPMKMPAAPASDAGAHDPMLDLLAALFATGDGVFVADAICLLFEQAASFCPRAIQAWQATLQSHFAQATLPHAVFDKAAVLLWRRAPDAHASMGVRVRRESILQGLCQCIAQRDDALTLAEHLPRAMRDVLLVSAQRLGRLALCRQLLSRFAALPKASV